MATTTQGPPRATPQRGDWSASREVVETALDLQADAHAQAEAQARTREMAAAAAELGLDPALLPEAERRVRARAEERARREVQAARRRRWFAAGAVAAVGVVVVSAWALRGPEPVAPWTDGFAAGSWALEASAGTQARLSFVEVAGRGAVAQVEVDRFVPLADGRYWVNLESLAHPDWTGASELSFAARAEGLGNVRVYLESPEERWRGPAVPVGPGWSTHTLPLSAFERQVKRGGDWQVVGDRAPRRVDTVSFKLGGWVNDAGEAGTVWIDDLSAR